MTPEERIQQLEHELEQAIERRKDTQDWYAVRLVLLRKLADDHNITKEYCDIVANGSSGLGRGYPPTFEQMRNMNKHHLEKAREKLAKVEGLILLWEASDDWFRKSCARALRRALEMPEPPKEDDV